MAREKLDTLMSVVAGSLARANGILTTTGKNQSVNYLVTELEISVPYSKVQLEGEDVLVELGEVEPGQETGRFLRFKVLPLPDTTQREQPGASPAVPDLKSKLLADSLVALQDAGVSLENVILKFDPKARAPEGAVASYEVKSRPPGQIDEIVLTIAGQPPDTEKGTAGTPPVPDKPADKPGGEGASGTNPKGGRKPSGGQPPRRKT